LAFKLRVPAKEFIATRHSTIRDEIMSVRDQLSVAQEKYDEFSAKLKAIDAEVANLKEYSKQDSIAMKQRILTEGRRVAAQVISDSKSAAESLFSELKGQLYSELAGRVLDRAELLLRERLTGEDRARMRKEFSMQVESIQ
jgi:F0F1-type ATP synthase membrane subunit b/b'